MKLILNDEVGCREIRSERCSASWFASTIEALGVIAIDKPEERSRLAREWKRSEFIYRSYQECWKTPIYWFVDSHNRQISVTAKVAFVVYAVHLQVDWLVFIRDKAE